ncbi:hypothetical protein LXL04_024968 [Taraxacum kok-saghyz]
MKITDSTLKNSASDLAAQNRENHFSFERMVKLVPVSQGYVRNRISLISDAIGVSFPVGTGGLHFESWYPPRPRLIPA